VIAWASLIVAAVGVLIALFAIVWTIHRDRLQTNALREESTERKAADAREEERREAELELLRARFQREEDQDAERLSARLVGETDGQQSGSDRGIEYTIRVRNMGPAPAEDAYVWLAEQLPGDVVGGAVTNQFRLGALAVADGWKECVLEQPPPTGGRVPRSGRIRAMWTDGRGEHRDQEIGDITVLR
jgi:hypothetical protein